MLAAWCVQLAHKPAICVPMLKPDLCCRWPSPRWCAGTVFAPAGACLTRGDCVLGCAQQSSVHTRAGDLLFLKGLEDTAGPPAVHCSPQFDGVRLVLTVDTAIESMRYFLSG